MNTIRTAGPWWPAVDVTGALPPVADRPRPARAPGEPPEVAGAGGRERGAEEQGAPPERRGGRPAFAAGGAPDPSGNAGRRLDLFA
ncbi:MAG TPA: hypothetical protein VNT51_04880 [Miltoncostaeaceae bacterium]|nr:hypothetical protein [Miltoncostaeaceae bacterium]